MAKVLVVYHTSEGHTAEAAERVATRLRERGIEVDARSVDTAPASLHGYVGVVAGGSVHAGHHDKHLARYLRDHLDDVRATPSAFFSVSLNAASERPASREAANTLAHEFLAELGWEPDLVAIVGGALAYTKYGFIKRQLMKRISKKEGGETDPSRDWDHTDWAAVDAFAGDFALHVASALAPASI